MGVPLIVQQQPGYVVAQTPNPPLGCSGLPRANPSFFHRAETNIRRPYFGCYRWAPGPNIPDHWFDGADGWVTKFYTDIEPFDLELRRNGRHRCQVTIQGPDGMPRHCNHEVANDGCCNDSICWCPFAKGPPLMTAHLATAHGLQPPLKRQWASDFCDMRGVLEAWLCTPCQGSRQMMALSGYADTFSLPFCLFFCFMGIRHAQAGGRHGAYWVPPHILAAIFTRYSIVRLNNIDEGCCTTTAAVICCPICSLAQSYREMSASGVWPGGTVCNTEPPLCYLQPPGAPVRVQ